MGIIFVVLGVALAIWALSTASKDYLHRPLFWSKYPRATLAAVLAVALTLVLIGFSA